MKRQILLCLVLSAYSHATLAGHSSVAEAMGGVFNFNDTVTSLKTYIENPTHQFIEISQKKFDQLNKIAFYNRKSSIINNLLFPEEAFFLSEDAWDAQAKTQYHTKQEGFLGPNPAKDNHTPQIYISIEYLIKRLLPNLTNTGLRPQSCPPWISIINIQGHENVWINANLSDLIVCSESHKDFDVLRNNKVIISLDAVSSLPEKKLWPRVLGLSAIAIMPLIYYHKPILAGLTLLRTQLRALL